MIEWIDAAVRELGVEVVWGYLVVAGMIVVDIVVLLLLVGVRRR